MFRGSFDLISFFIIFIGNILYLQKFRIDHYGQQEIEFRTEDRSRRTVPLRGFRGNRTGTIAGGDGPFCSIVYGRHRYTYLSFSDQRKGAHFSFAFIAPIIKATELYGLPGTLSGLAAVGAVYVIMSALVRFRGLDFIKRMFPPVVVGPVIMLIGLSLAGTGVDMAKGNWLLAIISLLTTVIVSLFGKGLLKLIPIFSGILVGYLVATFMGLIDFQSVVEAPWLALPAFVRPEFSWEAIIFMIPVAIAPVIEHIGDVYAINEVTGKDFVKDPGLHRTMLGDGLACMAASFIGGPPVTTYSEVTGAISLTKIADPVVIRIAAVVGILFSVLGKVSAILKTIPSAVLGGIMLLLFGTIASVGINSLIKNKVDMGDTRNLVIASLILTLGIGGAEMNISNITIGGIGLAALVGVVLNLIIPKSKKN